ncbi:mechanosensitive ion channel family protein [Leptolyngbya iicbica LK]|uniref:Mechanosensitive ion channel family protein n=2 Tax=Cyanophyceae TaxID=3028117 RepID=A0A4Q7EB53_9CYAN|nr:mechanosensitive ion channel family protein [Leptolyngbya sp. LK]
MLVNLVSLPADAVVQLPPLVPPSNHTLPAGVEQQGTLETAPVKLDGKTLFRIAAPAVTNRSDLGTQVPVEVRASQVEGNLQRLLPDTWSHETAIQPANLNVVVETVNGFPVLFAEGASFAQPRVILTVTDADAQYYGISQAELASQWQDELEQNLRQALEIRQPEALRQTLRTFFKVLIATISTSLLLGITWMVLGRREKALRQQRHWQSSWLQTQPASTEILEADQATPSPTQGLIYFLSLQRRLQFVRFLRWLNFWVVAFTWAIGSAYVFRLFPQTRQLARKLVIAPLVLLIAWFVIGLINRLIDFTVDKFIQQLAESQTLTQANLQRINTITKVIKGVKAVLVYAIGVLLVLQWLELVPGSVLALGTVLALVISFAAQNLIRDLVNGFMILLEDQYRIGDVVKIGEKSGLVETFNLRITQLRNPDGNLITLPNSSIVEVENFSRDWSRSDFRVEVAYDTDVDLALAIVRNTAETMAQDPDWQAHILDTSEFLGVEHLSHQGMVIRIWVKTVPIQQWVVAMELRRRLKKAFDLQGIRIGIPQQLWIQDN